MSQYPDTCSQYFKLLHGKENLPSYLHSVYMAIHFGILFFFAFNIKSIYFEGFSASRFCFRISVHFVPCFRLSVHFVLCFRFSVHFAIFYISILYFLLLVSVFCSIDCVFQVSVRTTRTMTFTYRLRLTPWRMEMMCQTQRKWERHSSLSTHVPITQKSTSMQIWKKTCSGKKT